MTYIEKEQQTARPLNDRSSINVPDYLQSTYTWAYLNPKTVPLLSSAPVVEAILWGNASRLIQMTVDEITPGQTVLQAAAVYGKFSTVLAKAVGENGHLDVIDVAPIQVETAAKRVTGLKQAQVKLGDASIIQPKDYDCVVCFFLLHEVPDDIKRKIVNALIASTKAGGKIIFVDYHEPSRRHPLRPLMSKIFDWLEPFAKGLWGIEIMDLAEKTDDLSWSKETIFGGLYQKIVVQKADAISADVPTT